jgi:hypothetical protein
MAYHVLAGATMVLHFAFLAFVVAGGFLAWRWPKAIWPHLTAAGWGFATAAFRLHCPLTWLEDWARQHAGGPALRHGFIDTYLTGIIYPERYTSLLQLLVGVVVTVSWIGALLRAADRHHIAGPTDGRTTDNAVGATDQS